MEKLCVAHRLFLENHISRSDGLATAGTEELMMGSLSAGQNIIQRGSFQNGELRSLPIIDGYRSLAWLWSIVHT